MAKKISKSRQQEILQFKIDFFEERRLNFIKYGISTKKIDKVNLLKGQFANAKAIVDAS